MVPDKIILIYGPCHISFQWYSSSSSNLLWNTSRFLFHPVLFDVSQNLWSFTWGRKMSCYQTRHKTRRKECGEYRCVCYLLSFYICVINSSLWFLHPLKKIMWLKLIHLNMCWTLSLCLVSSLCFPGYDEDHCNVTCWLLAKPKKSIWSAGDITWRHLGGASLCPPGMFTIDVYFSW